MLPNKQIPPDVLAAWNRGEAVEAIRGLRRATGLGLREAKAALESGALSVHVQDRAELLAQLPASAAAAVRRGDKIEAIRLVREATGLGLKEAKDAVEKLAQGDSGWMATRSRGLAPGEVPRSGFNAVRLVTVIGVVLISVLAVHGFMRP